MKEQLINKGLTATENNYINKASLYFGLLVITTLSTIIFLGISIRSSVNNENLEFQVHQRDCIIKQLEATNNELIYDNLMLSK